MTDVFKQRITRIQGLSDRRRLPRLGHIRGGIKLKSAKTGKEYPKETTYFVCPPEVQAIFGEQPTDLEIMIPLNDLDSVFPQSLKWYGSSKGLKCHGDMRVAYRYDKDKKDWFERECPCEQLDGGACKQSGILQFMIPKVSVGGVYQLRTGSYNSIVDINSGLDYVTALIGRFAMVPLTLRRVATETHHNEQRQTHYTYQIILNADITTLNLLRQDTQRILESPRYQLPPPATDNPELEPPDAIIDEEEQQQPPIEVQPQPSPIHPPEPSFPPEEKQRPADEATPAQKKKLFAMSAQRFGDRESGLAFIKWALGQTGQEYWSKSLISSFFDEFSSQADAYEQEMANS